MVLEPGSGGIKFGFVSCSHPRTLAVPATFKQQRKQCWSCTACGPGTSFHTLLVVYLEKEV